MRRKCGWLALKIGSKYKKKTHRRKGCGWLASRRSSSKYEKNTHRCKGCGWLTSRRYGKNNSLTKIKTY